MNGFVDESLLDKLFDDASRDASSRGVRRLSVDGYIDSVVRDIEDLLNSRSAFSEDQLDAFPECTRSLATYGVPDFSARSLMSSVDRSFVCRVLEQALARDEPRLKQVRVRVHAQQRAGSTLRLSIDALLDMQPALEPIRFDAVLQAATLQYSVKRVRGG
ncbi:MAG TPA: type VI secretion system baseplate subunit TssE [Nevskiaceae bacterium]